MKILLFKLYVFVIDSNEVFAKMTVCKSCEKFQINYKPKNNFENYIAF